MALGAPARRCTRFRGLISPCGIFSARRNNQPIYKLLGGAQCEKLPAYASLLKYADTDVVVRTCEEALGRGYRDLKVHETGRNEITVGRDICCGSITAAR